MTYKAFISYSHAIDDRLAPALQASLQRFAKPWNQLRAMRVFVDKASLSANPGLWSTIEAALADSEYFILLASPSSAQSFWVQKEVETWLQLGRANRLLIVLTGGEIRWSLQDRAVDAAATTALPGVLQGVLQEEPLYTDLQWVRQEEHLSLQDPRFTDAVAGLAATIRGISKDDLYGEHVAQHRKVVRLRRVVIAALAVLTAGAVTAASLAVLQRNEARRQAQIALGRQLAAQAESARTQTAVFLPYSIVLGVESIRTSAPVEAYITIQRALALLPAEAQAMQHGQRVRTVAIQSGKGQIATASDGVVRLWDPDGRRERRLTETSSGVSPVIFSPDGRLLVAADRDRSVRVWSTDTAAARFPPLTVRGVPLRIAFSPDGRWLAASNLAGSKGNITVWEVETGAEAVVLPLERATQHSQGLAFSSDGRLAAVGYSRLLVWDTATWKERPLEIGNASYADVRFSADGMLAAGGASGKLWVWDAVDPRPKATLDMPDLRAIAFSANGAFVAAAGAKGEARVWDTKKWVEVAAVAHDGRITSLAFSPSGSVLATASADGTAALWSIPGGTKLTSMDHADEVMDVEFTADGGHVVTASADGTARIWETRAGADVGLLPGETEATDIAFGPAGNWLVKTTQEAVWIWRAPESRVEAIEVPAPWYSAALSADGRILALAGAGAVVHVWNVADRRESASLAPPGVVDWDEYGRRVGLLRDNRTRTMREQAALSVGAAKVLGVSGDGRHLLTTTHDFVARAWDIANRRIVASYPFQSGLSGWAFSSNGEALAVIRDDRTLDLLTLADGRNVFSFTSPGHLESAAINSTGTVLIALEDIDQPSGERRMRVWRAPNWSRPLIVSAGAERLSVVLSPDGEYVAVAQDGGALRVLRTSSGDEAARFDGPVTRVIFSPDSRLLAFAGTLRAVRLWDLKRSTAGPSISQSEEIADIGFTPDAKHIATAGQAYTRVFAVAAGDEVARILNPEPVGRVRFSSGDGKYLATNGAADTRVWVWRPDDVVRKACARLARTIAGPQWPVATVGAFDARIASACPGGTAVASR